MEFLRQSDEILSVGEFSRRFKMLIKTHIPELWLKGEISNLKTHSSGHTYFTLKDDEGSISAVLFKGYSRNMTLRLADGMRIFAFGEISIYEARGNYQIVVKAVIPDGAGDLAARFQALKEKLAAEGVFDADRKKQIPLLPRRVAVATSPQGAAIRDFCRILSRRGWKGEIVVIPARVQGAEAAGELCEAVRIAENFTFPDRGGFDLLILMRGGGSLEDLWPFNEEKVARAVSACSIPTISAVGHEIDFTLSDFAADLRAETPSAAAEVISSARIGAKNAIDSVESGLDKAAAFRLESAREGLEALANSLRLNSPEYKIREYNLALDADESRLRTAATAILSESNSRYLRTCAKMERIAPERTLEAFRRKLEYLEKHIELLGIDSVLNRGFALATDSEGNFISRAADVPEKPFGLRFCDGDVRVEKI